MHASLRSVALVFGREFRAYFATPLAAVFLAVFLALSAGMTFFVGGFFERGQADLGSFFAWHPWLFLILMPAIGMRLWAEERRAGTLEFLLTSPVAPYSLVFGKFLGWNWLDPLMGIVGALVITRWSFGLLRDSSGGWGLPLALCLALTLLIAVLGTLAGRDARVPDTDRPG